MVAVGGDRPRPRARGPRGLARSVLASGGLVLVLAGAAAGALDPVGAALAVGAAVIYTAYILVSEGIAGRCGRACCPRSSARARR